MDLRGPIYNTNVQVRDLERLVERLPRPGSGDVPAVAPRKRSRTARQLNAEEAKELIAGYQAGAKLRELGAQLAVHPGTAGLILRRNGIKMRPNGLSLDQEIEAERLYATGLSLKRVGEKARRRR